MSLEEGGSTCKKLIFYIVLAFWDKNIFMLRGKGLTLTKLYASFYISALLDLMLCVWTCQYYWGEFINTVHSY